MKLDERLWPNIVLLCISAGFIGFVGGAAISDGESTAREWIGALSGWFAGLVALLIGRFTVVPLLKDMRLKERNEEHQRTLQLLKMRTKLLDLGTQIGKSLVVFDAEYPELMLIKDNEEQPNEALNHCISTIDEAEELCSTFAFEKHRLALEPDTSEKLHSETAAVAHAIYDIRSALIGFQEELGQSGIQIAHLGTPEQFLAFLEDVRNKGVFQQISKASDEFTKRLYPYIDAVAEEQIRLQTKLMKS